MSVQLDDLRAERQSAKRVLYYRAADGVQVCGARLRNRPETERCAVAVALSPVNGRCRLHGGVQTIGRPVVHGQFSERFGRFRDALESAIEDERIADMRRPLAVLHEGVERAAERASEADTPEFRRRALKLYREVSTALAEGDVATVTTRLRELGTLLHQGVQEDDAFQHLVDAAERHGNRMERYWGIRLSAAHAINLRDLQAIFAQVMMAVREECDGPTSTKVLGRIAAILPAPSAAKP